MTPVGIGGWPVPANMPDPVYNALGTAPSGSSLATALFTDASAVAAATFPAWTDLAFTLTFAHGRRPILLTCTFPAIGINATDHQGFVGIREGATLLNLAKTTIPLVATGEPIIVRHYISTPDTNNSHTYKISLSVGTAADAITPTVDPTFPAIFQALEV